LRFQSNAKSPDVPGGVDIAFVRVNVSSRSQRKCRTSALNQGKRSTTEKNVLAGLVPAIYVLTSKLAEKKDVDAQHKAGHDEPERS
jgi:hypothetical protein